jgi:hypothetical protein
MRRLLFLVPILLGLTACVPASHPSTALGTPSPIPAISPIPDPAPTTTAPTTTAPTTTATAMTAPTVMASADAGLSECDSAKLTLAGVDRDGAGGTLLHFVRVDITGPICVLRKRPRLESGDGKAIAAPPGLKFPAPADRTPAVLRTGERAAIVFETYGSCLDGRPQIIYTDVRLVFPDGRRLPLDEEVDATCGVRLGAWFWSFE